MVFEILYFLILAGSVTLVVTENRNPMKALIWVLLLTLLPGVGLVAYLLVGKDFRSRRIISDDELRQFEALRDHAAQGHLLDAPDNPTYRKLCDMMRTANSSPLFAHNDIRIFTDFRPFWDDLLADIANAQHFIHIQFYIIEDDEVGRQLRQMLIDKARQGVDVRLMYDSWANLFVNRKYYKEMARGGVKVQPFLQLIPSVMTRDVNCRTHRKIVVIDGTVGYTGGMNIARRYRDGIQGGVWRDTHIRLTGPAVSQLELALLADWRFCTKEMLLESRFFPVLPVTDQPGSPVQIITSGPMDEWNTVMQGMVQIIAQSRRYLYLQTPYFIPTEPILLALRNAALAGVDVRVMMPSTADRGAIMLYASQSYFHEAMRAGVKIYLYRAGYLHAKTMVADDEFVTIGSTNIDSRSFEQNFEVNAFIYDPAAAIRQRDIFLDDATRCTQVDHFLWMQRPLWHRLRESLSRLLTPLL